MTITPQMMLDWSVQWMPVAEDGFKAEMIWLADFYGLSAHSAVNGLTFTDPEWEYFAFKLMPQAYKNPNRRKQWNRQYEILQEEAIYNIGTNNPYTPLATGDDDNLIVHKVIWANQFGKKLVRVADAISFLQAGLQDASDDQHAKNVLALAIMDEPISQTRLDTILAATEITPQTYHAQLCALVVKGM